jgi:VIT1/CCC1 family predicted Fe2+/Mn2+ transporter
MTNPNHTHKVHRIAWLRAAVLGANDGIVSTASLIIGVAAAGASLDSILLAGVAGLVAGTMSMAAGEYVSVASQADTEQAELKLESQHLNDHPEFEIDELTSIYIERGLDVDLAYQVAKKLTEHNALAAHARDELGITDATRAQPLLAASASALSFSTGAALPLLASYFAGGNNLIAAVSCSSLIFLAGLGVLAARAGGASMLKGGVRVVFWGALAMLMTAVVGDLFGVVTG